MPRTFDLHIQSRDAPTVRVLPLPGLSARIGRGPQCEVRLDGPALAEIHCLLRRRGETWHIQPIGPPEALALEGRPVITQRPLPPGVPLRVGEHWLTIRPAGTEVPEFRSSETPILIQPVAPDEPGPAPTGPTPFAGRAYTDPTASLGSWTAGHGIETERDRLRRWENQLEQRERWLKARQDERRWEARWRAAGASLRSQNATGPGQAAPPTRPAPTASPGPDRPGMARPSPWPNDPGDPPGADVSSNIAPATYDDPARPEPPLAETPPPVDPEVSHFRAGWEGDPEPPEDQAPAGTPPVDAPGGPPVGTALATLAPAPTVEPPPIVEPESRPDRAAEPEPEPTRDQVRPKRESSPKARSRRPKLGAVRTLPAEPPAPIETPEPTISAWTEAPATWDVPRSREPSAAPVFSTETMFGGPVWLPAESSASDPLDEPTGPWPAATRILQGVRPQAARQPSRRTPRGNAAVRPMPTVGRAPAQWTLPLWLTWLPASVLAVAVGGVGLALTWTWAQDDRTAGLIADRVLGRETLPEGPVLGDDPGLAEPAWWRSTAGHLGFQALAVARDATDPEAEERVGFLLHTARHASPLDRGVRYARARRAGSGRGEPEPAGSVASLGLSRDVVALAWTGRHLLDAGKTEPALDAYRRALELAASVDPARASVPAFDPQARRFLLPGEELVGRVVGDLADHGDWPFAQWSATLGSSPVALLSAYRVLRRKESSDAGQALDLLLAGPGDGPESPTAQAARAEALAFKERWDEAAACYQAAIDRMPIDLVRRSWWVNVASIADHLGDDAQTRAAWANAKGSHPGDPIAHRVAEAEARSGLAADPTMTRTH